MTADARERWDQRYADGSYTPRTDPTPFLADWLDRIPPGRALDVATGTGRNALLLAERGFAVDAVDISEVAVSRARETAAARGLDVRFEVADLETGPLPGAGYDLVTVIRYRDPALWPRLVAALAPDGWVVVEHHLRTHLDAAGPQSDEFRLEPGELLTAFGGLRVVHYDERVEPADLSGGVYVIARMVACAGDPGW
jgi:SAM-dependent methyltransferase